MSAVVGLVLDFIWRITMIVIESKINNTKLIFSRNWYLHSGGQKFDINIDIDVVKSRLMLTLILFLELDKKDIFNSINEQDARDLFPLRAILASGFLMDSEYWTSLSVEWLCDENALMCRYFIHDLQKIIKNKKYSQKIRHKAMKILSRSTEFLERSVHSIPEK